jgi:phage virion morphogenesis protein
VTGTRQPFSVEIDDADLRARLQALTARVGAPRDALREIGEILQQSTQKRFQPGHQKSPAGVPWAPNSPVTLARKAPQRNILTGKTGLLGDLIRSQLGSDGRSVAVGTNRKYGAMMQFGGTKAQHPHLWGNIPARPFLGISTDDRARIQEILSDYLGRNLT